MALTAVFFNTAIFVCVPVMVGRKGPPKFFRTRRPYFRAVGVSITFCLLPPQIPPRPFAPTPPYEMKTYFDPDPTPCYPTRAFLLLTLHSVEEK